MRRLSHIAERWVSERMSVTLFFRIGGANGEVDINRKDYRAWYGLGQAYELLGMHQYALYYYQQATALRYYFFVLEKLHALRSNFPLYR